MTCIFLRSLRRRGGAGSTVRSRRRIYLDIPLNTGQFFAQPSPPLPPQYRVFNRHFEIKMGMGRIDGYDRSPRFNSAEFLFGIQRRWRFIFEGGWEGEVGRLSGVQETLRGPAESAGSRANSVRS